MSAAPAQKEKYSTSARVAITNGPAAAAVEPRKNKYKKFIKAIESERTMPPVPGMTDMDTETNPGIPMQTTHPADDDTELTPTTPTNLSATSSTASSPIHASHLLFEDSPTPQTSPTPKRMKLTPAHTSANDHNMWEAQPLMTPRSLSISRSEGDITITRAPRLFTGQTTSLHDRLLAAQERTAIQKPSKAATRNPLDKYTNDTMPNVHVADPTTLLNFININLVLEWENYDNGKLLAIPFGNEVKSLENHDNIGGRLLTAASEITQSDRVGVSAPVPSDDATLLKKTPTSFLIYNLTTAEANTLMQRGVWSSKAITFRVADLHPPRPDFLFTLQGFKTRDEKIIKAMVKNIWGSKDAQQITDNIVDSFTEECHVELRNNIQAFLNSLQVNRLIFTTKEQNEVPRYNIYAKGEFILDDDVWLHLRESLANLPYTSYMQGRGHAVIAPSNCGICHGVDHPTSLCEFPGRKGWNGPTSKTIGDAYKQNGGNINNYGTRSNRLPKF